MKNLLKNLPYELFVGLRYTRAKRKNHFISFISLTSMIGIALGVWALIVVMSVMNGFHEEIRNRILSVASHIEITGENNQLADWPKMQADVANTPRLKGSAPYVNAQGMLTFGQSVQGVILRGILPNEEAKVADIGSKMVTGKLADLKAGEFGIVLGSDLARSMGVFVGDKVVVLAPQGQFTPTGLVPRIKQFKVVGLFQVGMKPFDDSFAFIHLKDAQVFYRMGDSVSGLRLKLDDLYEAPNIAKILNKQLNSQGFYTSDWTLQNANFFSAIQLEKRMVAILLIIIVLVAAFNIVSTLVMAVTDKRADIAIMRTFGASPASIMKIFMVQGVVIRFTGILIGTATGLITAVNIDRIIPLIERIFNVHFLDKDIYFISELPSHVVASDVVGIVLVAFILSLLATIYPSYKASQMKPAEALRYE